MIYFISDLHYNHANIIDYTSRQHQIATVEEMNNIIIKRWNKIVKNKDIVYCLGDFCFGNSTQIKDLVKKLKGNIILVKGNHDPVRSHQWYLNNGFYKYYDNPIIIDDFIIVSHEPIKFLNKTMPYINIHGHTHDDCFDNKQRINVSWEILDGYPIDYEKLKEMF